jgi:S1-C subfamily serine protease
MLKFILPILGAALIFAAGWWVGERQSLRAILEVPSPVIAQAATPTQELQTERQALLTTRHLNIASMAALFEVEESVAEQLLTEYETVRERYRQMTRDGVPENDPQDVADHFIQNLAARAEANPVLKQWLAGRPGTIIGESVWGASAVIPRLKGPLPDFLLAGKYGHSGTGCFISPDGWLVTNAHVVGERQQVDLRGVGGLILTARVVKTDTRTDLALLKADTPPRSYLEIYSSELPLGTRVFTIGFPNVDTQGAQAKFTEGSISSLAGWRDDPNDYQISVPLQQGNSGGALVDTKTGLMAGMVTSSLSPSHADSVGYAIKAKVLADLLRSTPEFASIPPPIDAAPERDRVENIERAQKASVMVLVK